MHYTAEKYAEKVVGDVLGGASGRVWRGAMATSVRWVVMLMPTWLLVRAMTCWWRCELGLTIVQDRMQLRQNGLDTFGKTGGAGKA